MKFSIISSSLSTVKRPLHDKVYAIDVIQTHDDDIDIKFQLNNIGRIKRAEKNYKS